MHNLSRRDFLSRTTIGLSAAATLPATTPFVFATENQDLLPIIDTHQHLWDLTKFRPPWLGGAPEVLRKSYVTKDFLQATQNVNVVKAVYMEVDVDPERQVDEAEHILGLCASDDHPTAGAVISGRPNSTGFATYINRYKDNPRIKGVRQVLHVPEASRGLCLEPQFVASIKLLGEMGKSFDICIRPTELSDAVKLVDQCGQTRFIVDHCGNADPKAFLPQSSEEPWHEVDEWKRGIHDLAQRENVICKISGIVARVPSDSWDASVLAPIINFCLDEFGPDRVVFGGDWPVCLLGTSYEGWVNALKEVISSRSRQDQQKLLHDNAERLYGLG